MSRFRFLESQGVRNTILRSATVLIAAGAFILGCSDSSEPDTPLLALDVSCVGGAPEVTITNTGGAMETPAFCRAEYEDGAGDSISVMLSEGQTFTCSLSNLHGKVRVRLDGTSLGDSADDCLSPAVLDLLGQSMTGFDLDSSIPDSMPLTFLTCNYTIRPSHISYDAPHLYVERQASELKVWVVFESFSVGLEGRSPGFGCLDFTGTTSIDSITATSYFSVGTDGSGNAVVSHEATLIGLHNLDVRLYGLLGALASLILNYFEDDIASTIESQFQERFADSLEGMIQGVAVGKPACE